MLFSCQLLDALEHEPPPPIERRNGTFEIRAGDCESCKHYQPAGGPQLMGVMKKSRARWKAKRKRRRTVEKSRSGATAGGESI